MKQSSASEDMDRAFRQAEEARRAGHYTTALAGYLEIISTRLAGLRESAMPSGLTAADLVVLERAADLAALFGHDKGADDLLSGMVTALETARNVFAADYLLVKRIHLALSFGHIHHARELLQTMKPRIGDLEAIDFTEAGLDHWESKCLRNDFSAPDRAVSFSRLYLVMGWLLALLGQYGAALLALRKGLTFTGEKAPELARLAVVPLGLNIAAVLMEQGDLKLAIDKLDELEAKIDERREPGFYVRHLELRGKTKMLGGDFGGAVDDYLKALKTCRAGGFTRAALAATLNLANALIFLNNTDVALRFLVWARREGDDLKEQSLVARAELLLALARERSTSLGADVSIAPSVSTMRGGTTQSTPEVILPQLLDESPRSESFLTFFENRSLMFSWQLGRGNLQVASQIYDRLRKATGASDSILIWTRLQILEGITAYYSSNLEKAELLLNQSLTTLARLGLLPDLWQAQRILGWCWSRLGVSELQRQELAAANRRLLESMTGSLAPGQQAIFLMNKWTDDEEFIAGEIKQLIALKNRLVKSPWFKRPWLRWSLMKRLYSLLRRMDHHKEALAKQLPSGQTKELTEQPSLLWKFIRSHPRNRATLYFLVLPDQVFIVIAGWMTLDFGVSRITRNQVRDAVRRWHLLAGKAVGRRNPNSTEPTEEPMEVDYVDTLATSTRNLNPIRNPTPGTGLAESARKVAEELAGALQIPSIIKNLSRRVRSLTIIPHDSLLGFPFAAIIQEGRYLIERFNLNIDFGIAEKKPVVPVLADPQALFVGIASGAEKFSFLSGVLPEIKELETWAAKRKLRYQTLVNEAASKATVVKHLSNASLLHIACHGVFKANEPDRSGFVLVSSPGDVDILSLRDLSTLNLRTLQHATLSSCWSADNFILPGRWIIGLPETLRRAGAQSVLACLWEVDDQFSRSFTASFYEYLNKYPRDEALRRAQLDCLRNRLDGRDSSTSSDRQIDSSEPFYWASYTLYGNYDSLQLS